MWDGLKKLLISLMTIAFEGFDQCLQDSKDVLTNASFGNEEAIWETVLGYSDVLKPFCLVIIAICLLIELANVAAKVDLVKWEYALRIGIKMCLARVCLDVAPTFLRACYLQAQSWIANLAEGESMLGTTCVNRLEPLVNEVSGLGNILGIFVSSFIVLLAVKVCGLIVQVIAYGRIFEMYVYLVASPIPCAFLPLGNGDGSGFSHITMKFFKSFAAICLQGVMMIVVIRLFDAVIGNMLLGVIASVETTDANAAITNLIFTMLLGSIALVMSVTKCGSWAKSILDTM